MSGDHEGFPLLLGDADAVDAGDGDGGEGVGFGEVDGEGHCHVVYFVTCEDVFCFC